MRDEKIVYGAVETHIAACNKERKGEETHLLGYTTGSAHRKGP